MVIFKQSEITDAHGIAKLHLKTFPRFFLSTLGISFLTSYYKSCVKSKDAISICAVDNETKIIVGFAVGCFNSKGFNKKLIYSNLGPYVYQTLILIFTRPFALVRLFKNLRKGNVLSDNGNYAELLSIGVSPNQNGLGIGQSLLVKFENQVREKGINTITLTTDADSNDSVLRFYKKSGYSVYYNFETFPNRKMLKLIKEL